MVQVAAFAQWMFAEQEQRESDVDVSEASSANRRNLEHSANGPPQAHDLKWRPGQDREERRARAKELRKAVEQRALTRDAARARQAAQQKSENGTKPQRTTAGHLSLPDIPGAAPDVGAPDVGDDVGEGASSTPLSDMLPAELWAEILARVCEDPRALCALARLSRTLHDLTGPRCEDLWKSAHMATFGKSAASQTAEQTRLRCCESEGMISGWLRASRGRPSELALPSMLDVQLGDELGVSLHDGKLLRLWDAKSGARLACQQLVRQPSCCHLMHNHIVVGDASGLFALHNADDMSCDPISFRVAPSALTSVVLFERTTAQTTPGESLLVLSACDRGTVCCWSREAAETFVVDAPYQDAPYQRCSLAESTDGHHVACRGPTWCASLDVERGLWAWQGEQVTAVSLGTDSKELSKLLMRSVCASKELKLLGSAHNNVICLWDVREAVPVATLDGEGGSCKHIQFDSGYGQSVSPHHLMVTSSFLGGACGVGVLDIRRLDRKPQKMLVTTLAVPKGKAGRGGTLHVPFDARDGAVVAAGHLKDHCAYRWQSAMLPTEPSSDGVGVEEEEDASPSTPRSARDAKAAREKPKRMASGAKGRNNGAPGGGRRKQ